MSLRVAGNAASEGLASGEKFCGSPTAKVPSGDFSVHTYFCTFEIATKVLLYPTRFSHINPIDITKNVSICNVRTV